MASTRRPSGLTLVEAVVAMTVLLVGSVGLLGLHGVGTRLNADGRVVTRATAIAQDLVSQMQSWDYANDPRLANTTTSNDLDFYDGAAAFEGAVGSFTFDHQESELDQPPSYRNLGVPGATVQGLGFTRYWNVAELAADADENGVIGVKRIAVIVRWEQNGAGRRIVLVTALRNPAGTN